MMAYTNRNSVMIYNISTTPGNAIAMDYIAIRKLGLKLATLSGLRILMSLSTLIPFILLVTKYETIYD